VKSETDPHLSAWYKANSLIYVAPDHACWNDEDAARKVKKQRFGGVKMSEVTGVSAMMRRYLPEAQKYIEDKIEEREILLKGIEDDTQDEADELAGEGVTGNGKNGPMVL
jgi:histone deacetylase 6